MPATITAADAGSSDVPEQVVITGSRLGVRSLATQTARDVHIYERPQIEQSGQSTLSDFLNSLPEVSLNSVENAFIATPVRLRGAAAGSALILINGRRTQPLTGGAAPFGFFDLNTIPLALVERIEVLPVGSSAVYGGEALAGVVNVILKSDFTGVEADAGYRFANDTDEKIFSLGAGWKKNAFSASIMGSYSDRSPMFGFDRAITASPDYRAMGGPNLGNQFFGAPANVTSVSGNLPGLNSSFAAVPIGSTGIGLTPSDFAATAGTQNTGGYTRYQSLVPGLTRGGIFATASYRFRNNLEVFTEILWSSYKEDVRQTPPFFQFTSVPASNPFNPFGTAVNVSGVVIGAESLAKLTFNEDYMRPLVGARGNFGAWEWEVTGIASWDRGVLDLFGQPNTALRAAALASPDPSAALNPFVDGPMASPALLASIYSNQFVSSYKATSNIVNGFVRGPLWMLPGGPLDAVLGGEYEESTLKRGFEANRNAKSAFAELRAPILGATNENGSMRELFTVQGAVRYDDYSDFGSKTTWQAGVEVRPFESLLLRGTHATAFKPPTLYNIGAPQSTGTSTPFDPKLGNQQFVVQSITGGNPSLDPTTSVSDTVGLVWSPLRIPRFNVSLTPWWLKIDNAISLPNVQFIVNNEDILPGRVVRAAAPPGQVGQIVSVDYSYINFGTMNESGIDGSIDWTFKTSFGEFTPAIAATYMTEYRGASTPGAPPVNRLSRANNDGNFAPRWKGTASIAWAPDAPFKLWFAGRYIGRYQDYTPPRTIGDLWYFDATLELDIVRALHMSKPPLSGIKLLVSGTNLTDKLPPYSTFFRGYDIFNYDLVGRTIFMRLQLQM